MSGVGYATTRLGICQASKLLEVTANKPRLDRNLWNQSLEKMMCRTPGKSGTLSGENPAKSRCPKGLAIPDRATDVPALPAEM